MRRPTPARGYQLHIPKEIEQRLRRCRSSTCQAIRTRLLAIAAAETAKRVDRRLKLPSPGPPLRFYSSESYRVSYQIDPHRRKIVVLELRKELEQTGHVAEREFEVARDEHELHSPSKVRSEATERALSEPRSSVSGTELSRQDRQVAFRHNQHTRG
jgi:hypothetical protein